MSLRGPLEIYYYIFIKMRLSLDILKKKKQIWRYLLLVANMI